jgi:hypothetical protein
VEAERVTLYWAETITSVNALSNRSGIVTAMVTEGLDSINQRVEDDGITLTGPIKLHLKPEVEGRYGAHS